VDAEQLADVGPGELLIAGGLDDLGKQLLGEEAGVSVNGTPGVAESVGGALW
jgi:hypothetical protein